MSWGRGPSHRQASGTPRTEQPGAIATAQESLISESAPSNGRTARRRLRDAKGTLVLIGGGTSANGPAIGGFIEMIITGVIVGAIYKPAARQAP